MVSCTNTERQQLKCMGLSVILETVNDVIEYYTNPTPQNKNNYDSAVSFLYPSNEKQAIQTFTILDWAELSLQDVCIAIQARLLRHNKQIKQNVV